LEEMIRTYSRLNDFQYDDIDLPKVGAVVDAGCAYCATILVTTLIHNPLTPITTHPTLTPTHSQYSEAPAWDHSWLNSHLDTFVSALGGLNDRGGITLPLPPVYIVYNSYHCHNQHHTQIKPS
jgi:hypothetical protein